MSTWTSIDKAIPKRKYRERGQLASRKHKGLLEKHKDYKLRAEDYHKKEKKIHNLMGKARLRNPDEFYFKMINSKMDNGRHKTLDPEEQGDTDDDEKELEYKKIRLTQGENIIKLKKYREHKKVEKLKSELHMINFPKQNTHQIILDDADKFQNFDLAEHFNTVPELLDNYSNRLTKEQLENIDLNKYGYDEAKLAQRLKNSYKKLTQKMENEERMKDFYLKLDHEKQLLSKDKRTTKDLGNGQKEHKFFIERKR